MSFHSSVTVATIMPRFCGRKEKQLGFILLNLQVRLSLKVQKTFNVSKRGIVFFPVVNRQQKPLYVV